MEIDWAKFDDSPENTNTCRCGTVFRSHSKIVMEPTTYLVTRKPCPGCGRNDNCRGSRSDPETFTIKGGG